MSDDLHTVSGAYALNAVEPDEAREFERHMSGCQACRDEVRELRATAAAMGAAEAEAPPAALKARVLQAAARQPQLPPVVTEVAPGKRRRRLAILVAAAAAVVAVVVGVVTTEVQHGSQLAQPVAAVFHAPDSQTVRVRTSNGGTLTVAVSHRLHEMAVDTHRLPPLPTAQVYQLWEMAGGHARSAGLVDNPAAGQAMPLPPRSTRVAITIEPAGGSVQPTTQPIVVLRPSQV